MPKHKDRSWPPLPEPLAVTVADNHTHLDIFGHYLPHDLVIPAVPEMLAQAAAVGVDRVVQVGSDLPSVATTAQWVAAYPSMLGGVALHPNEAPLHAGVAEVGPDGLEPQVRDHHRVSYEDAFAQIAAVAAGNDRIRVIGETGLDLFRTGPGGAAAQRRSFRDHIALAKELGLALQIHDRDAHREVVEILLADGAPERTVFHCFSGGAELAAACVEHGWYVSVAGPVTFNANGALREAVRSVPAQLLQVETDAPFLTPAPYRGRPNAPYLIPVTVRALAQIRGEPVDALAAQLSETAEILYGPW